jgi:hypothetical protein
VLGDGVGHVHKDDRDCLRFPLDGNGRRQQEAAAFHIQGRLFVVISAANQSEAEAQALAKCNDDPDRKGADGPCFLYAVENRVVLPQRCLVLLANPERSEQLGSGPTPTCCRYALANQGHDTRAIQGWLGHRSISTTAVYTALAPNRFKDFGRD